MVSFKTCLYVSGLSLATAAASAFPPRRHLLEIMRGLQSEECETATNALYDDNLALQQAAVAFSADYDAAVDACETGLPCIIDEDIFPSTPGFITACANANGVIFEYDLIIACTVTDGSTTEPVELQYLNVDLCFDGDFCNAESISADIEREANVDLDRLEDGLTSDNIVTTCSADVTVSDGNGNEIFSGSIDSRNAGTGNSAAPAAAAAAFWSTILVAAVAVLVV